jgi:hypothetical protein
MGRVVVMRNTTMSDFDDICQGRGLLTRQARVAILAAAKRALGNAVYERVRSTVLGPA